MAEVTWEELKTLAHEELDQRGLNGTYQNRLTFEQREIEKQGATTYWINLYNDGKKFDKNPGCLVLPWLLGMVEGDPIANRKDEMLCTVRASEVMKYKADKGHVPCDFVKDPDMPDIDLDCLPEARDPIKEYAAKKYGMNITDGYGPVCSVGTWQTYKFRSALIDTMQATAADEEDKKRRRAEVYELTTSLPDDVDELKDGGAAACKERIKDAQTGEEKECGHVHTNWSCPKCSPTEKYLALQRQPPGGGEGDYEDKQHHGGSKQQKKDSSGGTATDSPTIGKLLKEHEQLRAFARKYPQEVSYAVQIIGRVRNMGMHAGALIIADRTLFGNIPLAKSGSKGYWVSMWSEGRNTQLSKFGYIKWDILGLKTLKYIFECCRLIEQNRGISFGKPRAEQSQHGQDLPPIMSGWDDIDPTQNRAGHFYDADRKKRFIELNDVHALRLANEQKTDGVFQFDTDLAKSILANGVRNFEDLMLFNAMGHPGPMASIPEAVENRDDPTASWKKRLHPDILRVLESTYGVIVYQEQLQAIWQLIAGFTAPQAQEARKAVAKKWTHKLKPIREQWLIGASRVIGDKEAAEWWPKMETFGRYAFNRSHAVSYCLVALRCLWLKAHFAPEWWAAVMSDCHPDKLVRYMGIARAEKWEPTDITYCGTFRPEERAKGVVFDTINITNLTTNFTATGDKVNQGMIGIKGIGEAAADKFVGRGSFTDIDEFIEKKGAKSKTVMERFIKLGAFSSVPGHENSYATWMWYQYKYCSGKDITQIRQEVRQKLLDQDDWNDETIEEERKRQTAEYKAQFPNRRKIPNKIQNWTPKPDDTRERVMALFDHESFSLEQKLEFEKQYLGYYLHSPLDVYDIEGDCTIEEAKEVAANGGDPKLEVVITELQFAETKTKKEYARLIVSDGVQTALLLLFSNELALQDASTLLVGTGIQACVDYDDMRGTFTLKRNQIIVKLLPRDWRERQRKAAGIPLSDDEG